jgi:hypothetical protein
LTDPPYALHAVAASSTVRRAVVAALLADRTIRALDGNDPSRVRMAGVCRSRLDGRWVAASVAFPDTGLTAWFHQSATGWRVFLSWRSPLPPGPIILSLASCSGYSAAGLGP